MRYEIVVREGHGDKPRPRRRTFFVTAEEESAARILATEQAKTLHGFTLPRITYIEVK